MPKPPSLEALRLILKSDDIHVACAQVLRTTFSSDNSTLFVRIKLLPEGTEMVSRMSWDASGPGSGIFQKPEIEDLVLIAFAEGSEDSVFVIRKLSSQVDKIPSAVNDGNLVLKALLGKKIMLGKAGDSVPAEAIALGDVLKTFLGKWMDAWLDASEIAITPMGPGFLAPAVRAELVALKAEFLTAASTNILSQVSFTERGD